MLVNNLLVALGRQRYALYYAAAALALAFGVNALTAARLGAVGAAWTALGSYAWLLGFSLRFAARQGYAPGVLTPLLRTAAAGAVCLAVCRAWDAAQLCSTMASPMAGAMAGTAAYAAVILALGGATRRDLDALRRIRHAGRTAPGSKEWP